MAEYITREFITGADLREMRALLGLTQKELAQIVGVTSLTLSRYEKGEWTLNQSVINKIRELYGFDIRPLKSHQKTWQKR